MVKMKDNYFVKLYKEKRELTILEWVYGAIAIVSVVLAGIFALFNQSVGVAFLIVPLIAAVAFSMNLVSWAIVKLVIESFIPKEETESESEKSEKPEKTTKSEKPSEKSEKKAKK